MLSAHAHSTRRFEVVKDDFATAGRVAPVNDDIVENLPRPKEDAPNLREPVFVAAEVEEKAATSGNSPHRP